MPESINIYKKKIISKMDEKYEWLVNWKGQSEKLHDTWITKKRKTKYTYTWTNKKNGKTTRNYVPGKKKKLELLSWKIEVIEWVQNEGGKNEKKKRK